MGPVVRSRISDNTDKLKKESEEKIKKNRENMVEQTKKHQQTLKEMEERVQNRPLLMLQTGINNAKKLAKIENLKKIRDTMLQSGIKDPEKLFDPEDRDILRQADLLQKTKAQTQV